MISLIAFMLEKLQYEDPADFTLANGDIPASIARLTTKLPQAEEFPTEELLGSMDVGTNKAQLTAAHSYLRRLMPSSISSTASKAHSSGAKAEPAEVWMKPNFTLKLGSLEFPCHDWVLCSRWSYARDALAFGGHESRTSTLELPVDLGFSSEFVEAFLLYLYTSDPSGFNTLDLACSVFDLAPQFRFVDVEGKRYPNFSKLIDYCYESLIPNLTPSSCVQAFLRIAKYGNEIQKAHLSSAMLYHLRVMTHDPVTFEQIRDLGLDTVMEILKSVSMRI